MRRKRKRKKRERLKRKLHLPSFLRKDKKDIKNVKENNDTKKINDDIENNVETVVTEKKAKRKDKKRKKEKKKKRKWWKKLLSFFLICGALGVFLIFAFCIYIVSSCGEFNPNALANQDQTIIYDSNNNIIAKLGIEKRESVKYEDLPQVLVDAIIATEDSRYFEHNGVDGFRFLKASVGQILGNSSAGGASTLTMQVVKNNLTSTEQTITRKFKDIYLAVFFMEKKYTKEEILEFYVNDSYLGGSVYGVEEASNYYFNKSVSELSLPEATIIAGLFQAPSSYNPYNFPEAAAKRRSTVLKLMVRHGYITQEEADIANAIDVTSLLAGNNKDTSYQGFIDTVVSEVQNKTGFDPALTSMEIYTTMDPSMQDGINKVLAGDGYKWKDDKVQAGVTILDVNTGAIVAIGTGRNRNGERLLNFATQTKRQPGSTAKPVFAYGPGFEFSNFSTYQLFVDEEWKYTDGTKIGNWDNDYDGLMTLKRAVAISRNIPALKAFQAVQNDVGNKKIVEFVEGLGIDLKNDVAYESYSIGGLDQGVSTLQMAAAYAAFANGGYYTEPHTVKSITYRDTGETVEFEIKKTQAMKESTAYLTSNVLEYAAKYGFDGGTKGFGGTIAVKTGTSNFDDATLKAKGLPAGAVNDLWSVAYTPQYSIALWYGYEIPSKDGYSASNEGGKYKDPLMKAILKYVPKTNDGFKVPSSVVKVEVEKETWPAQKPSEYTPADMKITEYFIAGTEPTDVSPRYAKLNAVTNLKATPVLNGTKITWEHEIPKVLDEAYLKEYFSQSNFGNSGNKFLEDRLNYNKDILGGLGYRIYLKDNNGNLKEIAYTNELFYIYNSDISGDVTLVVKAQYKNFTNNDSDGVEVKFTIQNNSNNNDNSDNNNDDGGNDNSNDNEDNNTSVVGDLKIRLSGKSNINVNFGAYKESGVVVTYKGVAVNDKATIRYYFNNIEYKNKTDLENAVNATKVPDKNFTITYKVKYKDEEASISRTVSFK